MTRSVAGPVAAFELRRRLSSSPFWVVVAITALTVFGAVTVERIQIGPPRAGPRNDATGVAVMHLVWSLFFLFTAVAFVTDAVAADERTGFGPIARATPSRERDRLLGRFGGALAAVALSFAAVPAALFLGTLAPWLDPSRLAPNRLAAYVFALLVLALPNLLTACALSFALAVRFGSAMAGYLGAIALLLAYDLAAGPAVREPVGALAALLEPFGFAAYARATAGAPPDALPSLLGPLGANRLLWLGIGIVALALSLRDRRPRDARYDRRALSEPDATPRPTTLRVGTPRFGPGATAAQLAARLRWEVEGVVRTPTFGVLLLLGLGNAALTTVAASRAGPLPTAEVAPTLAGAFRLVPVAVAVVFAGELAWGERDRRTHELVGAAPVPNAALLVPKLAALLLVLVALLVAGAAAAAAVQLWRGGGFAVVGALARDYVLPGAVDWALVATLALFLQALAPSKVAGWGLMVLYLIAALAMENLGWVGSLYRYGGHPDALAQDLPLWGWTEAGWVRTYWACLAAAMALAAFGLSGRGGDAPLQVRLRRLARSRAGLGALAALAGFVALGVALFGAGVR